MNSRTRTESKTLEVRLLRNYRPEGEGTGKQPAGEELELPIGEAKRIIGLGIAERNDPLPN